MGIIPGSKINLDRDEAHNTAIIQQYYSKVLNANLNGKTMLFALIMIFNILLRRSQKNSSSNRRMSQWNLGILSV